MEDLGEDAGSYFWHVVENVFRCVRYSDTKVKSIKLPNVVKCLLISHSGYTIINVVIFQKHYGHILACLHVVGLEEQQGYIPISEKFD